jgi:hypothetical protein
MALSCLERFRFKCCHLKIMRGSIFLRKMPLGVYVSVKSRIETAVIVHPDTCTNRADGCMRMAKHTVDEARCSVL